MRQALAGQTGPDWKRARQLLGPEAFTFLDRVHQQLAALPVDPELRAAAVQVEGLRRQPQAVRGESAKARALRGVLLASELVLALAQEAGQQALQSVRGVLDGAWRASSLVEGLNGVVRMHQGRQKRLTQGLLDLKRLYWNLHRFGSGRRRGVVRRQGPGLEFEGGHDPPMRIELAAHLAVEGLQDTLQRLDVPWVCRGYRRRLPTVASAHALPPLCPAEWVAALSAGLGRR